MCALSSREITVKQRIILHLNRFPEITPATEFNVPFDLTQDGIASVVGITRAHASIELKKLTDAGLATGWAAHMKGTKSKRRAYCLEVLGRQMAADLEKEIAAAGMLVEVLLDMKRCDAGLKWDSLSPEDRNTFGIACTIRVPIPRNALPPTPTGVIPTDFYGVVQIPRDIARSYLQRADPSLLKSWHSWAADWWLNQNDDQERLHHLVLAGRNNEACRLAVGRAEHFLANPNEDLLQSLQSLPAPEPYAGRVLRLEVMTALACGNLKAAERGLNFLQQRQDPAAAGLTARLSLEKGDAEKAVELAVNAFTSDNDPDTAVTAVRGMLMLGRTAEAEAMIGTAVNVLKEQHSGRGIGELLTARAGINYANGDRDGAVVLLSKAAAAVPGHARERTEALISEVRTGRPLPHFW